MNTYLINISSYRLIEEELNKITKGKNNIININNDESSIEDIIDECAYFSLLNEEKIVIVNNFKINSSSKILEKYLDNPNLNTKLILIVDSIDKRNSLYKKIKSQGTIIEIGELSLSDLTKKINTYCKNNNLIIDYMAVNKLIDYNLNNYDLILNEIDKLAIISNKIDEKLVEEYSFKLNSEDNFEFCDAIISKNYKTIKELLEKFIIKKMDVIPLVALLAGQYRIIYAVLELNKSNEIITSILNIHPYRVKLARDKSYLYTKKEIENNLLLLCDLDKKLKTLYINQYDLLKEFLIKLG